MANYPKKTIDPTEAALSAIQEALNIRDEEDHTPASESMAEVPAESAVDHGHEPVPPPIFHDDLRAEPIGSRDLRPEVAPPAANDDRQSIGQILQMLQRRPAHTSYFVAAVFSAAWIVGCLALSWAFLSDLTAAMGPGHSKAAIVIGLGAAALLPIIFFFGVAHMAWRAQELRLIAQSMAGVAMRLAEPESVARDSIVSVGQAIRREVAAMGDGVERALARASELETMVHNEVAALGRSYGDNEVRIRTLIQDLASQRDTLVSQAEQVRSAINNVHIDLTQDLSTISELVGQQVNEAAQRITNSLAEKGEHITLSLGQIGDDMIQQLSDRGGDLLERLESTSSETSRAIATASDRLTSSLKFKTDHIGEEFADIAQGLEDMMTGRLDSVVEGFSEKSLAVVDLMVSRSHDLTEQMVGRSQELSDTIIDTSSRIADRIATSAEEVNSTLKTSSESLVLDLNLRGGEVAAKLEQAGTRITDALISRSSKMTESVRESAEQLVSVIVSRSDAMKELLATRLAAYEEMFSHSGVELGERISRDAATLGNLITRHLTEFDRTVKTYGAELVERLGARTQDVSESMRGYIDSFDSRVSSRTNEVTTTLDERLTRFQETLDTRTQSLTEALSSRVMDIARTLAEGGKDVVNAIDKRVTDVATMIDSRGQTLADAVSDRVATIDKTLGVGAMQVAGTLDSRIEQLEQLLIGRAEAVVRELDTRSRAAADTLSTRVSDLSEAVKTNTDYAERTLSQLLTTTNDSLGKSAAATAAVTEALNRGALETAASMSRSAEQLTNAVGKSAAEATESINRTSELLTASVGKSVAEAASALGQSAEQLTNSVGRSVDEAAATLNRNAELLTTSVGKSAAEAASTLELTAEQLANSVGRNVGEATATLNRSAELLTTSVGRSAVEAASALGQSAELLTIALSKSSAEASASLSRGADLLSTVVSKSSTDATVALNRSAELLGTVIGKSSAEASAAIGRSAELLSNGVSKSAAEATASLNRSTVALNNTIAKSASAASEAIDKSATTGAQALAQSAAAVSEIIEKTTVGSSQALNRNAAAAAELVNRTAVSASDVLGKSAAGASETIGKTVAATADLMNKTARTSAEVIGRTASEAERTLVGMSADVAKNISGKAEDIHSAVSLRVSELRQVLEEKGGDLLGVLSSKGEQFANEVGRVTDQAVKSIEAKGFVFTQTMMDNSEEIARLINDAGHNATAAVTRTLSQLQEGAQGVADTAKTNIARTLSELHEATRTAIDESKQTAAATVADMLETHNMLRNDSTALFERLREANILLQEVLSGAHENMNAIEHTMVSRVSEFVSAMNDLDTRSGTATAKVEQHLGAFNTTTVKVLHDLGDLATSFTTHGRALAEAVELLEKGNRRTEDSIAGRHANIEALVTTLDARTDDFEQRLRRFSGLLDESLDSATSRAREIASIVAESSNESVHTIEQQFDLMRAQADEQRKRTSEALGSAYEENAGELQAMFTQTAERFADIMQGMKHMASEMQRELEATRAELRRGVFELPQETAESAAQMRRVIVDQIEALAELNRIVARHGRALDAVEPIRREAEPAYAAGGGRAQPRPVRPDSGAPARPAARDITGAPARRPDAPSLSPIQGGKAADNGRGGWLSDLLTRASRDESPPITPSAASTPREAARPTRDSTNALESLSVDIARMIDHEATADLWERYQRGERGFASPRLYTAQGQKAFEEIRNKYRTDPEFRQTVEHYIHEFERLLDEVSRGDRGPAVARNYLTSDTGKVYTMLAHAAGRFD